MRDGSIVRTFIGVAGSSRMPSQELRPNDHYGRNDVPEIRKGGGCVRVSCASKSKAAAVCSRDEPAGPVRFGCPLTLFADSSYNPIDGADVSGRVAQRCNVTWLDGGRSATALVVHGECLLAGGVQIWIRPRTSNSTTA